MLGKVDKVSIL